jgi:predicted negative regulator of RcsB-dependent stress response
MLRPVGVMALVVAFGMAAFAGYEADLEAAVRLAKGGKQAEALAAYLKLADGATNDLGRADALRQAALLAGQLKQPDRALDDKAVEAFRRVKYSAVMSAQKYRASLEIADISLRRQQPEQALKLLDTIPLDKVWGDMPLLVLRSRAEVLLALGRKPEALEAYRAALKLEGLPPAARSALEKAAEGLTLDDWSQLMLAARNKTDYQVVLPDAYAAPEIGHWLTNAALLVQTAFKTNGFDMAVVSESRRDPEKPGIFLGDTAFARNHGVKVGGLAGWSYVHKVAGSNVILAGLDAPWRATPPPNGWRGVEGHPRLGTVKAVTAFLREYAGTRFLYPTATGIEYLPVSWIAVPAGLDRTNTPMVQFNFGGYTRRDVYSIANNYFFPVDGEIGVHTWDRAIPAATFRETNPEYFALINNQRCCLVKSYTGRWTEQYCIGNPQVRELIYRDLLAKADRGYRMVGLGQPDGFQPCQCEECGKLYGTGDDWGEKIWILHRDLAERLLKDRPDRKLVIISYGQTWGPPKTFKTFPKNVMIMWCRMTPELLEKWSAVGVPGGTIGYLYIWGTYNLLGYTAQRSPVEIAALVRKFQALGLTGLHLDGSDTAFGMEGPNYYLFGRLFDDPATLQTGDVLEEFYEGAFREAATSMRRFYDTLYHAIQFASDMPYTYDDAYGRKRSFLRGDDHKMKLMAFLYSPEVLAELETHLSQAEKKAISPKVKARLALVRLEFDYARHIATVAHLHNAYRVAPDSSSYALLLDAVDHWHGFLARMYVRNRDGSGDGWMPGMRRSVLPDWPDFQPFLGHSRHAVALTRFYADTPLNWDTAALRKNAMAAAPAAGAGDAFLSRQADAEDRGAFGAPAGVAPAESPVRKLREELYRASFRIPATWTNLTALLPDSAWGPWMFREDPADKGQSEGWYRPDWNMAGWSAVQVPAFWAESEAGDYLGYGWYRTTFTIPAEWKDKSVRLLFGSVDEQAWVYVNGRLVREHTIASEHASIDSLWDTPFGADVPADLIRYGAANVLAVRVQNVQGNGGIWRPVFISAIDSRSPAIGGR